MLPAPAHARLMRRALFTGAGAGVVLELTLTAAFLTSHWLPGFGLDPASHRTLERLPFVLVGGLSLLVGLGAFALALGLALWPPAAPDEAGAPSPAAHARLRRLGPQHRHR